MGFKRPLQPLTSALPGLVPSVFTGAEVPSVLRRLYIVFVPLCPLVPVPAVKVVPLACFVTSLACVISGRAGIFISIGCLEGPVAGGSKYFLRLQLL